MEGRLGVCGGYREFFPREDVGLGRETFEKGRAAGFMLGVLRAPN